MFAKITLIASANSKNRGKCQIHAPEARIISAAHFNAETVRFQGEFTTKRRDFGNFRFVREGKKANTLIFKKLTENIQLDSGILLIKNFINFVQLVYFARNIRMQ